MGRVLRKLKVGDGIAGVVVEVLPAGDLIVSIDGDLLRVANETREPLQPGDHVPLSVVAVQPLRFVLLADKEASSLRRRFHVLG